MTMQRRHYELIAETIKDAPYNTEEERRFQRIRWAHHFATYLSHTNPNFNSSRFLRACGLEEG